MRNLQLLFTFLATFPLLAQAQTLDEWFRQRETQKEYLVQQIAALQAYAGTLRQGYQLLSEGISTVQHIKNGDLGLHQAFFQSLGRINPAIGQSPLLQDILTWQAATQRTLQVFLQQTEGLTAGELAYLQQVRTQVLAAAGRDTETLWLLLTEEALDLRDDERLSYLALLHQATGERYRITRALREEARLLALQRKHALHEVQTIRSFQP